MADPTLDARAALTEEERREAIFVQALEAQIAAQRHDPEAGVALAQQVRSGVDGLVRKRWGAWQWVGRSTPGRVVQVDAPKHRTRTTLAPVGAGPTAAQTVKFGAGTPRVQAQYPVHIPVRLPDAPTPLITGPVSAGTPWLKAPGGATWIYYMGFNDGADRFALYRVALPPMDDLAFLYDPQTVLHLGNFGLFSEGDEPPHNIAATYATSLIWADVHHWETFIADPDSALTAAPYPINLHRYKELGTFGPPSQTTDVHPSTPHLRLVGSNLGVGAPSDYLLGTSWYSEQVPEIPSTPATPEQRGKDVLFDLVWSDGGGTWLPVRQRFCDFKRIWAFFPDGGFYVPGFAWKTASAQGATGWIADSATPWGAAGARVHVWAVQERDTEPYPDGVRLNGDVADQGTLVASYLSANIPKVRWYVSQNGGPATRNLLPVPAGWLGATPQDTAGYTGSRAFWGGTLGGQRLWAWWLGHEAQSFDPVTQQVTPTPTHLWYGTGNQDGSEWGWEQRDPAANADTIQAVNGDGSVLIVSVLSDPVHFISTYYISEDTGAHWRTLPAPPFWDDSFSSHQLWLVDTP